MSTPGIDDKKFSTNTYTVEIDGISIAAFNEVSGVSIECQAVETVASAFPDGSTALLSYPGVVSYGDLTLKMGKITDSSVFFDWLQMVVDSNFTKALRNGTLMQLPHGVRSSEFSGDRWHFVDAWPSKWEIAPSGAGKNALIIESLTLKVAELKRDAP